MESSQSANKAKKAVVIYHDNCMDGFASAWAFHILKEKDYEHCFYEPCSYGSIPDWVDLWNRNIDVYIVDFSFPRDIITRIANTHGKITILDHHKTAQEALENWEDKPENVTIVFDMKRSGAGITWDYFQDDAETKMGALELYERPSLINYVEDRDLWKFKLEKSKEVNAVIAITPKDFKSYSMLSANMHDNVESIQEIGQYLLIQHQQICESIVKDARSITIKLDNLKDDGRETHYGLVCNCTPEFRSEVGDLLHQKSGTFGATYHSLANGTLKWSIRSFGDYDVEKIAKAFRGGGHKNAAGFVIDLYNCPTDMAASNLLLRNYDH